MTCYGCEDKCTLYDDAKAKAKDYIDLYLVSYSCKHGCPKGYDKDEPCYPLEDEAEEKEG